MKFTTQNTRRVIALSTLAVLLPLASGTAVASKRHGYKNNKITVYFTRHAEKMTTTTVIEGATNTYEAAYDGSADLELTPLGIGEVSKGSNRDDVCGTSKCAEELNPLGLVRRDLLAKWFSRNGITRRLDAVYSSHKVRTYQTVEAIAADAGLAITQYPLDSSELEPEGTGDSECPTIEAILNTPVGDTILVAGHSGTLYDIMGEKGGSTCTGLGLDVDNADRFPKDDAGKVANFGDIWKVTIRDGVAKFEYRINLQPTSLRIVDIAR